MNLNLIHDPFIPVIYKNGESKEVSTKTALADSCNIARICACEPIVTASLLRYLLVFTYSAIGELTIKSWKKMYETKQFGKIEPYLNKWESRFNLFDKERPFMQLQTNNAKEQPIHRLQFVEERNASIFHNKSDIVVQPMTPAQAAQWLITANTFTVAGGAGRFAGPVLKSGGASFMLESNSLFDTLILNISHLCDQERQDLPCWEQDEKYIRQRMAAKVCVPDGYADAMTWLPRSFLLNSDLRTVMIGDGYRIDSKWQEDDYALRLGKKPFVASTGVFWKDFHSLFYEHSAADGLKTLRHLRAMGVKHNAHLAVFYVQHNTTSGMQHWGEDHYPIPHKMLDKLSHDQVKEFSNHAANVCKCAKWALRGQIALSEMFQQRYWTSVEQEFWKIVDRMIEGNFDLDDALDEWNKQIHRLAKNCLKSTMAGFRLNAVIVYGKNGIWHNFNHLYKKLKLQTR